MFCTNSNLCINLNFASTVNSSPSLKTSKSEGLFFKKHHLFLRYEKASSLHASTVNSSPSLLHLVHAKTIMTDIIEKLNFRVHLYLRLYKYGNSSSFLLRLFMESWEQPNVCAYVFLFKNDSVNHIHRAGPASTVLLLASWPLKLRPIGNAREVQEIPRSFPPRAPVSRSNRLPLSPIQCRSSPQPYLRAHGPDGLSR